MKSGRDQLKAWMKRCRLNQRRAAVVLKTDETYISKLMRGHRRPGMKNAIRFKRRTGIPVEAWAVRASEKAVKS